MMKIGKKLSKKDIKELQEQIPELPQYHNVCDSCNFSWYDRENYNIQKHCPQCNSGEIYVYGEEYDNF